MWFFSFLTMQKLAAKNAWAATTWPSLKLNIMAKDKYRKENDKYKYIYNITFLKCIHKLFYFCVIKMTGYSVAKQSPLLSSSCIFRAVFAVLKIRVVTVPIKVQYCFFSLVHLNLSSETTEVICWEKSPTSSLYVSVFFLLFCLRNAFSHGHFKLIVFYLACIFTFLLYLCTIQCAINK